MTVASFVQRILEEQHLVVDVTGTVETALALIDTHSYDLVVLAVAASNSANRDICQTIRSHGCGVAILILIVGDAPADRVSALDAGADACLALPLVVPEFLARVRALLRRHAVLPT
ncbi:MAG: hypothetical protein NVS4B2_33360 [Chloroflexota bacterium]